jgi:hypothetical protein
VVAEWTGVAVALDCFGKDDLVDLVGGDAGLDVRRGDLEYFASELERTRTNGSVSVKCSKAKCERNDERHTVADFRTPS